MILEKEPGHYKQMFQTWGEYVEYAKQAKATQWDKSNIIETKKRHSRRKRDGSTFKHTTEVLAIQGWPEGSKYADVYGSWLFDKCSSIIEREDYFFEVTGADIDMAAYTTGIPECFIEQRMTCVEEEGQKIFHLIFGNGATSGVSTQMVAKRGAVVVALIQLLEYAGYSMVVDLMSSTRNFKQDRQDYSQGDNNPLWLPRGTKLHSSDRHHTGWHPHVETWVPLKRAGEPIDTDRLLFALAHRGSFAQIAFAIWEALPQWLGKECRFGVNTNCGAPIKVKEWSTRGDLNFPEATHFDSTWKSDEDAIKWILDHLKRAGLKVRA